MVLRFDRWDRRFEVCGERYRVCTVARFCGCFHLLRSSFVSVVALTYWLVLGTIFVLLLRLSCIDFDHSGA